MNTHTFLYGLVLLSMTLTTQAISAPLDFAGTPARDAAAQISDRYGINIVFRGALDTNKPVTFTLANADTEGARLQAVNALANALSADFQKTYVVSKADAGAEITTPKVDTNADIAFPSRTISAQDAVQRVAGVDSATAQYFGAPGDTVTLSALNLSATETARQVSEQTHTRWKVFFAMTPRTQGRVLGGKVIGHTSTGAPIIEEPYVYYHATPVESPPVQTAQAGAANSANPSMANGQQNMNSGYSQMPYGFYSAPYNYPYGFDTYAGNNPYTQNIYAGNGYGGPFGGTVSAGSGLSVGTGFGYDSPIIFGGGGY